MKLKFYLLILGLTCIIQCMAQKASIFTANWNDHIDAKSRNEINSLNNKLVASFHEGAANAIYSLYSERLKKVAAGKNEMFINTVHSIFTTPNYTILDEYLYKSSAIGETGTVFKSASKDNDYSISFQIYTKETYISLLIYSGSNREFLITAIYGKYVNEWKLDLIRVGPYKIFGKNAIDFYKRSKIDLSGGDLIDAAIHFRLAQETALPAENTFNYFKLSEMKEFGSKLAKKGQEKLPWSRKITEINSLPQIFDAEPVITTKGVFPTISYLTTIRLEDTTLLKAENDKIKTVINKISPDITNNEYIFFKAYNRIPDGKTLLAHYGFMLKKPDK